MPRPIANPAAAALLSLLLLAACGEPERAAPATQAARPPGFAIQSFPPEAAPAGATLPPGEQPAQAENDPSAPPDTPLCGTAARETNAAAAALSPRTEAEGGACLATACYDALTDTYIGADGYRHVCQ